MLSPPNGCNARILLGVDSFQTSTCTGSLWASKRQASLIRPCAYALPGTVSYVYMSANWRRPGLHIDTRTVGLIQRRRAWYERQQASTRTYDGLQ
jgi:hypothetical protein